VARAVAVVGMLAVHVGPTGAPGVTGSLYALPHGRASILFGLLAGVGVALLARSRSISPAGTRGVLVWRAALLLPLGLWLQHLDHGVRVILADHALLFLTAAVVLTWRTRALVTLAATSALVGGWWFVRGGLVAPATYDRQVVAWGDPVGEVAHRLVLSGAYPLITWTAALAVGLVVGRLDLASPRLQRRLVAVGAAVAVLVAAGSQLLLRLLHPGGEATGWWGLLDDAPHRQSPVWVIAATGAAVAVLGACLVVARRWPRASWPLAALGQLAFTFYVGHLLVLHVARDTVAGDRVGPAVAVVVATTVVAAALAVAWRRVARRGPLELLLHLPRWLPERQRRGTTTGPG
jgi:uncharacterized membrane protein YeiB